MITTNARYNQQNDNPHKPPVYAMLIDGISQVFALSRGSFTNAYVAGEVFYGAITQIDGGSRSVVPEEGRSTIGGITVTLNDIDDEITPLLQNFTSHYLAQPRKVKIWAGYDATDFGTLTASNDAPQIFTGTIQNVKMTSNGLGFTLDIVDMQILALKDIFTDASETNQYTYTGIPHDLLLQWLTSTGGVGTVSVGTAGYIERSTNGINFYRQTSGAPAVALTGITYGASKFVACNATNTDVYISTDGGITWSTQAIGIANFYANKIRFFNGYFILVGSDGAGNGKLATSTDAITWTSRTVTSAAPLYDVAYGAGVWVAIGGDALTNRAGLVGCFSSSDAATWTGRTADGHGVVFGGTTFVAVGWVYTSGIFSFGYYNITVYTSTNGATWTARTPPSFPSSGISGAYQLYNLTSLAYYNGLYIAVGANGAIYTTTDGITWTSRTNPRPGYSLNDVIWTGAQFFAVGNNGTLMYSLDGIDWVDVTEDPPDTATNFYASAYFTNVNGAYDILPRERGCAWDINMIDVASFTDARDTWWNGETFSFTFKEKENAKAFFEDQILKLIGAYFVIKGDGKLALSVAHPPYVQSGVTTQTFDNSNIVGMPTWDMRQQNIIDEIVWEYDYELATDKYWTTKRVVRASPVSNYGLRKQMVIKSKGMKGENALTHGMSDLGGDTIVQTRSDRIFQRFSQPAPLITLRTLFHKHLNEEGDVAYLTHPKLPNRSSNSDGLTNEIVEIVDKKVNWMGGYVDWSLLSTNWQGLRYGVIAPDGTADYDVATMAEKNTYCYICADTGYMADGSLGYAIM